jgi:hypothetical protein
MKGIKVFVESEAVAEVASHEDGGGREDHPQGARGEDRCVLPISHTNSPCPQGERDSRTYSRQYRAAVPPSSQSAVTTESPAVV